MACFKNIYLKKLGNLDCSIDSNEVKYLEYTLTTVLAGILFWLRVGSILA